MSDSPQIRLQPRESPEALCGFCRDSFLPSEPVERCEGCDSPYHDECWRDELGGKCTTLGCSNEKPARGPRRFHALRGRLRRRRRRRLLDGEMGKDSHQGRAFTLGMAGVWLLSLFWALTSMRAGDRTFVVVVLLLVAGGGVLAHFSARRR